MPNRGRWFSVCCPPLNKGNNCVLPLLIKGGLAMKQVGLVLIVLLVLLLGTAPAVAQAEESIVNYQTSLIGFGFVSCGAGGAGETVAYSGTLHVVFHSTLDDPG